MNGGPIPRCEQRTKKREAPVLEQIDLYDAEGRQAVRLEDVSDNVFAVAGRLDCSIDDCVTLDYCGARIKLKVLRQDERRTVLSFDPVDTGLQAPT